MRGFAGKSGAILLALAIITLIYMSPALPSLTSAVIGDGGDNYQFLGFQYVAKRLVSTGDALSGWTDYWRYPAGIQFQSAADSMLFVLLGLLLYGGTDNPILVYNLSVVLLVYLNLVLSYAAYRTWFSRSLSIVGAIMYGASFYTLAKVGGHVNLAATAGFPLFFSALYRIWRYSGRRRDFMLLAASSLYLTLSSLQYPLILLGALPFFVMLLLIYSRENVFEFLRIIWNKRLLAALATLLLVVGIVPFHGRKLAELVKGATILPSDRLVVVPPVNFILPNRYVPAVAAAIPNSTKSWIEYSVFLGFAEIVLVLLAVRSLKPSPAKHCLVTAAVVLLVICLGQPGTLEWLWPYPYLFRILPYRGIIEPARFYVLLYFAMTVLILLYLQQQNKQKVILTIAFLIGIERLPMNYHRSPTLYEPAFIEAVKKRPTRAVLDLPVNVSWSGGQFYDLYSVHYQRPIVNGYFHWSGDHPATRALVAKLREFECEVEPTGVVKEFDNSKAVVKRDEVLEALIRHDIRTVVVHKNLLLSAEHCGPVPQYIDALLGQNDRWEVLFDSPSKRVLWLRRS